MQERPLIQMTLNRDILRSAHRWLKRDFRKSEKFYLYRGYTHGCIGDEGVPLSLDGNSPFFEVPALALSVYFEATEFRISRFKDGLLCARCEDGRYIIGHCLESYPSFELFEPTKL
jgi:hypothetical protein